MAPHSSAAAVFLAAAIALQAVCAQPSRPSQSVTLTGVVDVKAIDFQVIRSSKQVAKGRGNRAVSGGVQVARRSSVSAQLVQLAAAQLHAACPAAVHRHVATVHAMCARCKAAPSPDLADHIPFSIYRVRQY